MFTGLIEEIGQIQSIRQSGNARRLTIAAQIVLTDIKVDDSICVSGVCLTVVSFSATSFDVQAVDETLSKTNLGKLGVGAYINLERSLTLSGRLGGHLVQGHVDTTARIVGIAPQDAGRLIRVQLPEDILNFVIARGSIALDGVSLTIAKLKGHEIEIALIPHTLERTTLGKRVPGEFLNVEVDLIGKYIVRQMEIAKKNGLSLTAMEMMGYGAQT